MIWYSESKYDNHLVVIGKVSVFYTTESRSALPETMYQYKDIAIHLFLEGSADDFIFYYETIDERDKKFRELRNMVEIYYDKILGE